MADNVWMNKLTLNSENIWNDKQHMEETQTVIVNILKKFSSVNGQIFKFIKLEKRIEFEILS